MCIDAKNGRFRIFEVLRFYNQEINTTRANTGIFSANNIFTSRIVK